MRSLFEFGRACRAAVPPVDGVKMAMGTSHGVTRSACRTETLTSPGAGRGRRLVAGFVAMLALGLTQALWSAPVMAATPPVIGDESLLDVSGTSATLQAQVNPEGDVTTYRFEYDTSEYSSNTPHGVSAPSPEGNVGSASALTTVTVHVQGLSPAKLYHFRVVATSSGNETAYGEDHTFTTQPSGGEMALPDGRQWEMVSPPNKHGATIYPIAEGVIQAAEDGSAISYHTNAPTELEPQGNASYYMQVFSTRGSDGWSSQDIATPHSAETGASTIGHGGEYRIFSSDLKLGLVEPQGPFTSLSSDDTERTPYIRHDTTCAVTPTTCYTPLLTAANVPSGTKFGGTEILRGGVEFVGGTPDLSHIVLRPSVPRSSEFGLTSTAGDKGGLYEWAGGQLQLVSILPAGEGGLPAAAAGFVLGDNTGGLGNSSRHAISDDGRRIVWTTEGGEKHLYLRDMATRETVRLDQFQGGTPSGQNRPARFETASSDGSKVFFADVERLTADSTASPEPYPGQPDIYEFDAESGVLTDLTVDTNSGESADMIGTVLGTSEDGSYVYFLANGALAPGATPGDCPGGFGQGGSAEHCNLYVVHNTGHEWARPVFIATLAGTDEKDVAVVDGTDFTDATARISPNGRYVAFMSQRGLTGYDTRDANSGEPDEEVYIYDAALNRLACASCDPTGARPVGAPYGDQLVGGDRVWSEGIWIAASIPGWTPYELTKALYQSRYLYDSGRLFFNSSDALVPADVNGTEDVYEYEPRGAGGCTVSSPSFNGPSDGCVGLISSGESSDESAFMDANADGSDAFFLTTSQLASQDFDTSQDLYDAHICSDSVPCASRVVFPPACSTGDSCKAAPSKQPSIFGFPSSATFSGAGNVTPTPKPGVGPRSLTRGQKLARALSVCRKGPRKKRAACERRARRRYAPKGSGGKANAKGGHR